MRYVAAIIASLAFFAAHSQKLDIGPKAGINFIDVEMEDFNPNQAFQTLDSDERGVGYHGGLFVRLEFASLFVQPEFIYTQLNQNLTAEGPGGLENIDLSFNRFDIPVLAGLKAGPLRLGVGPVASFNLSDQEKAFDESLRDATWGFQVGAGLDIKSLSIDVRYEGAFSNTASEIRIDGNSYKTDARASQILLSLSVALL